VGFFFDVSLFTLLLEKQIDFVLLLELEKPLQERVAIYEGFRPLQHLEINLPLSGNTKCTGNCKL